MRPNLRFLLCATALSFILLPHCFATEWQWSVPDGESRAYLWVPPGCERVRAVIVSNHNMIEQGILEHPAMRRTFGELGIAEVWVVPYLDVPFDFNKGAGEHFQRIIDALAEASGYGELKFAPVVPFGHSACATYPWNFAAWDPGRTLAVLSVHGDAPQTDKTGYGKANVDWGDRNIDGVPGLMVMGEYEWWEARLTPAFKFLEKHPDTPIAFLGDAGHGHYDYSDQLVSFLTTFVRKAVEARLPTDAPLDKPVALRPVDPKKGWLVDRWHRDEPPAAAASPFAQYRGDTKQAFWCFDEEVARATEAYYVTARGTKPQLLSVTNGESPVASGCGEPVSPHFLPLDDGVSFRLETAFMNVVPGDSKNTNPARWTYLPVGSPLGHATGGGPIVLSRIVGPCVQVSPDTFAYQPGRAEYTANRRNDDMWILAAHPGDDQYKSAVQQAVVRAVPNTVGALQQIAFPEIPDQGPDAKSIELKAISNAQVPVSYYVLEGPAEIEGSTLRVTAIPPRAKYPIKITVVAWQFGRASEPKLQTAASVEKTFYLVK